MLLDYIMTILPYVVAGIITLFYTRSLLHREKVSGVWKIIAVIIGVFFFCTPLITIILELIRSKITSDGLLIRLVIMAIGVLIYRICVHKSKNISGVAG